MKQTAFMGFLSLILIIYGLINYFLLRRGWQAFHGWSSVQIVYLLFIITLSLSYPLIRLLPQSWRARCPAVFLVAGAFYLGFMFYLFLLLILWDLLRLGSRWLRLPFSQPSKLSLPHAGYRFSFLIILMLTIIIISIGYINSLWPRLRSHEIRLAKSWSGSSPLKIAVISDLHLGSVVRLSRLKKIVAKVNSLEPDLVLMAGDMMDEAVTFSQAEAAAPFFLQIKARLGIIAVPGNHETYSRQEKRLEQLTKGYVRVLVDEIISLPGPLTVIGRRDRAVASLGLARLNLEDLLQGLDHKFPILLLDHQPVHLEEAERAGVDLQVSGHTHAGQLFPLNWLNRQLYEKNWGYHRRGQTHYYISCGVGTWGPPIQTAARPEIVLLNLYSADGSGDMKETLKN